MIKSFFLIFLFNFSIAKEMYKIIPSAKLERYNALINKIIEDCEQYIINGEFYLTNITRIIYCIISKLAEQKIFIDMKGMWRIKTQENHYINYLYIYLITENPCHDAS